MRAAAGAKPGGVVAEQIKVTADVIAVDTKTHMVTLKGPNQTVDLYVDDPAQLKLIKVGDQIEAVYTQALAVSVEPAQEVRPRRRATPPAAHHRRPRASACGTAWTRARTAAARLGAWTLPEARARMSVVTVVWSMIAAAC